MSGGPADSARSGIEAPPPVMRTWGRLYWLVAGLLAFDVVAMWLLTRWAA